MAVRTKTFSVYCGQGMLSNKGDLLGIPIPKTVWMWTVAWDPLLNGWIVRWKNFDATRKGRIDGTVFEHHVPGSLDPQEAARNVVAHMKITGV